ncbi:MAG: 4Fe-4S binding protein, partial [Oscillospiraceae bacterium]|nr:4Fe-4S binding protein [Oscillospiraceae bacterium]
EKCKRCSLCAKKCPVGAISGIVGKTNFVIDPDVCVRCGLCISSCKFGAISKDQ